MTNLISRIITALVLLPLVIAFILLGGPYLLLLLSIVTFICFWEIAQALSIHRLALVTVFSLVFLALPMMLFGLHFPAPILFFLPFSLFFIWVLFAKKIGRNEYEKLCVFIVFSLYVLMAISSIYLLQTDTASLSRREGMGLIFLACIATWANDSFAYFSGRFFGRHKLMPSVSAKKTWEGFFGGGICSIAICAFFTFLVVRGFFNDYLLISWKDFIALSLVANILSPLGDLIESRFKRFYEIKDSSNILPGHGGILDRIDGLLLVLPWTYFYAFLIR